MSPKPSSSGSSTNLNLFIAFIPTLLSILYFRWSNVVSLIDTPSIYSSLSLSPAPSTIPTPHASANISSITRMRNRYAQSCPPHPYRTRLFSMDPLVIYIEDFMSRSETQYLKRLAEPRYSISTVTGDDGAMGVLTQGRKSQSAFLGLDPVTACIAERAAAFQGGVSAEQIELLQTVKYTSGDGILPHFDWAEDVPRITTIFAYVACDALSEDGKPASGRCEGGATQFTDLKEPYSEEWCDVVDCEDDSGIGGVPFKAIAGNAVFWSNTYPNGTWHEKTMHAGMPIKSGQKVGLNIWTRRPEDIFYSD